MINILNRWTGAVLYHSETAQTIAEAVAEVIARSREAETRANLTRANLTDADLTDADLTDANLTRANLTDANLTRANLTRANLTRANLTDADLTDADLTDANLTDADLTDADLTDANLTDADLTDANLTDANLTDANLTRANLTDANLTDANLTRANLTIIRDDIWAVLSAQPAEAQGLLDALRAGKVDGSTYTGECGCLVSTLARCAGKNYNNLLLLRPNAQRPAERFFLAIRPGHMPENSQACKLAADWTEQWITAMQTAFGGAA